MLLVGISYIESEWAKYHFIESPKQYPLAINGLSHSTDMREYSTTHSHLLHCSTHTFTIHIFNIQARRPVRHAPFIHVAIIGTERTLFPWQHFWTIASWNNTSSKQVQREVGKSFSLNMSQRMNDMNQSQTRYLVWVRAKPWLLA